MDGLGIDSLNNNSSQVFLNLFSLSFVVMLANEALHDFEKDAFRSTCPCFIP